MLWLLDDSACDNVKGDYEVHADNLRQFLALSEKKISQFHFAVQMHPSYGSRQLVETLEFTWILCLLH